MRKMDLERLEEMLVSMYKIYTELKDELGRLKEMGDARDDTISRYEETVKKALDEKNRIIEDLRREIYVRSGPK